MKGSAIRRDWPGTDANWILLGVKSKIFKHIFNPNAKMEECHKVKVCRMCKSSKIEKFLDLGFTPPSDGFLAAEQLERPETHYPLDVCICHDCGLVQLGYVVSPEILFRTDYPYESSTTRSGREHFLDMSRYICKRFGLRPNSLVIDVGSNVGVLLLGFKEQGMSVLGIDPATNIAEIANRKGIETWPEFFNTEIAEKVVKKKGKASVITGTNVFAHIHDLHDVARAVDMILRDDGIFVIEAPYLVDTLNNLEYDTIYHEHLSYISVRPLVSFFKKFNMDVFDVLRVKIHGGSIRVFVCRKGMQKISDNVGKLLNLEETEKVYSMERLKRFAQDVKKQKEDLLYLLADLKKSGKRIVGVSAPAKGNTLLNYCKIDAVTLDYLTEKAEVKIGRFSPGMHIPVVPDKKLLEDKPDYALLLAWNFADEIIRNLDEYRKAGGKFIIPIPSPRIVQ